MKTSLKNVCWMALLSGLFPSSLMAQPEQWLDYTTATRPKAYEWLDLSRKAPEGVALPKLGASAYFGRWTTPMDPTGGRWFCLDRTRKSGPYNRLFVDRDGDGNLDDESPQDSRSQSTTRAEFRPIKMLFKGEDGPIAYHLIPRFYQFEERARLLIGSACSYSGRVKLAGKTRRIELLDNNVNGAFNDIALQPSNADRVMVEEGDENVRKYLGRFLEIDGTLFAIQVAPDGAFIQVKPAENVAHGPVSLPETITELTVVGENGQFEREVEEGKCTLPTGRYRIHGWTIDREDDRGVAWQLKGSGFDEDSEFDVTDGEPASLKVGEPVRAKLEAEKKKTKVSFSLELLGGLDESVYLYRKGKRARAPKLHLAARDGSHESTHSFEYG